MIIGWYNKCRWNPRAQSGLIAIKYNRNELNFLDAEKMELLYLNPFRTDREGNSSAFENS